MSIELATIFARFGEAHRRSMSMSTDQFRAFNAVLACRTPALGIQLHRCDHCRFEQLHYRSCRNRHCPKCQGAVRAQWVADRCEDVLDVPYFHLVFTLPHELNAVAQRHPKAVYGLLFEVAWYTLKTLSRRRLDGELGMTAVLHTWGQTLTPHIHLHCLIAGGAFNAQAGHWRRTRSKYLFPVKVMRTLYRGRFVAELRRHAETLGLAADETDALLNLLMSKNWTVYAKPVIGHAHQVLEYLGRYTYRIAIGHERLLAVDDAHVQFRYRDYRAGGQHKVMSLAGAEFMRRFLWHVLPRGFMRVRHYGFLGNRVRAAQLTRIRALLPPRRKRVMAVQPARAMHSALCPRCHVGALRYVSQPAAPFTNPRLNSS